jgi:ribosomal protein L19E
MKALIISLFAAALLCGCAGTRINWDSARQVKQGMTKEEVRGLMGEPYMVMARSDGTTKWIWSYANALGGHGSAAMSFDKDGRAATGFNVPDNF